MKIIRQKAGLTLVEIIIVVAVIAILASVVITTATRIQNKAKEQLTESTIAILSAALEQFADYRFRYKDNYTTAEEREFYLGLKYPVDCNDFAFDRIQNELAKVLDAPVTVSGHNEEYSDVAVMYFLLSRVPECRKTLGQIDRSLVVTEGTLTVDGRVHPLIRVIDPWGEVLKYDYYDEVAIDWGNASEVEYKEDSKRNFPLITSAGRDRNFGSSDDITNK